MECWKIKDVVFVEKGQGEFDSDKWDCTCSRVDSEEDGVRCYIISDITYSQMEKVLANMEERGMTSPTDQQVLCVIRNMEPTNN